jgi:hypothetical protein
MMDNISLHWRQPTGIFRSSDRITVSARPMECPGKLSEFHFSTSRHHLDRCPVVFASKYETNRSMRFPGPVNKVDVAPVCNSTGSFPLTPFWQYRIENCQSVTAHFCEQYQPISGNVSGLMASISDQ